MTATNAELRDAWRAATGTLGDANRRIPWTFAVVLVAVLVAAEAVAVLVNVIDPSPYWHRGMDWEFYRNIGAQWLADGSYYQTHQLAGPYTFTTMVDNLYPPHALLLFVPFVFLPAVLWWAIPVAILGYVVAHFRPAPWALIVMLLLLAWPRAIGAYLLGNTDIWVVAIVAAGLRWGWPAVFVTLKPTFAPLILLGATRPLRTAVAILALSASALLAAPLWFDYATAVANATVDPGYSLGSVPLLLIPIVARLSATRKKAPEAATKGGLVEGARA